MPLQRVVRIPVLLGVRRGRGPRASSAVVRSSEPTPPRVQVPAAAADACAAYHSPSPPPPPASSSAASMPPPSSTSRPTTPAKEGATALGREGATVGGLDGGRATVQGRRRAWGRDDASAGPRRRERAGGDGGARGRDGASVQGATAGAGPR
ncbi:hypothetical protein C2845_PM01G41430 [Panicum miliaceum]|uniref:Uncharacterized protein n=1 Tax=Panicum miliaceum TaxID=4540 RepID=A0A3L6TJT7_PANMI|nr:hypothetical protein C2845_PM01G41430 [Panicum miliaceum]